jgi:hypothetical protein
MHPDGFTLGRRGFRQPTHSLADFQHDGVDTAIAFDASARQNLHQLARAQRWTGKPGAASTTPKPAMAATSAASALSVTSGPIGRIVFRLRAFCSCQSGQNECGVKPNLVHVLGLLAQVHVAA